MRPQSEPTKNDVGDSVCDAIGDTLTALTNLSVELERLVHSTDNDDVRAVDFVRLADVTAELRDLQSALLGKREHAQRWREMLGAAGNGGETPRSTE